MHKKDHHHDIVQNNGRMPEKLDFITPTMLKILYVFHGDPLRELHEREVVRQARVSKGSANKILRRLSEVGVLNRERRGRMVFLVLTWRMLLQDSLRFFSMFTR
jgi:DNA-binding MarR family transcriptional regulator